MVVAYGLILPKHILEATPHGAFNIHASLLPHWRGAAPINRAIMAGDSVSGVSIMRLTEGLDAGPVCLASRVKIGPEMTAGELHDALAPLGAELMVKALAELERGRLSCHPQHDEAATYAPKLDPREMRINWRLPARDVHDRIRGLSPSSRRLVRDRAWRQARAHQSVAVGARPRAQAPRERFWTMR